MTINKLFLFPFLSMGILACSDSGTSNTTEQSKETVKDTIAIDPPSGISPPFSNISIPFMNVSFLAETGGVFVSKNGSVITFPPNAVLNEDGTAVVGEFEVAYREFLDPIDIFFSGIPMRYDSAGVSYNFISAGMCELNAYQNGKKLKVNPSATPDVQLVSNDSDPAHNLYYFDEANKQWVNKGKSEISDIPTPAESEGKKVPTLIKPVKKDGAKRSFKVAIDKSEVAMSEFDGYDQMEFQIADEEKNYDPNDSKIHWNSVEVEKSAKYKGKYVVIFKSANITKSYLTDPVFSEADYSKAKATYDKKVKENELLATQVAAKDAAWLEKQAAILKQNKIIDSLNKVFLARNLVTQAYNDSVEKLIQDIQATINAVRINQSAYSIQRSISFSGFGVWNQNMLRYPLKERGKGIVY